MSIARRTIVLIAVIATLAACAPNSDKPPSAAPTTSKRAPLALLIRGQFTLDRGQFLWSDTTHTCAGLDGYDDIDAGTSVIVTDNTGATIALGKLGAGQPVMDPTDSTRAYQCMFTFDIKDVPGGKGFYGIEVSHRGKVQFPEAELNDRVQLSLT